MISHSLTAENYFSAENTIKYMSSSQFKGFMKCEAAALAELSGEFKRQMTDALLVGSYVDAHFEGTLDIFKAQHPEIFTRNGDLRSQYRHAEYIIQRAERDKLYTLYMSGEKQVIMVGKIAGVDYKIKIDSYHPGKAIVDQKVMKDFKLIWDEEKQQKQHYIDYWGYTFQGAVYQEIVRQNTGEKLPFYLAPITKEQEPDLNILWIPDERLSEALRNVIALTPRFQKIKEGILTPQRCEKCSFCHFTKVLKEPVNYLDECEEFEVE